jgi:hypothetical protein
MEIKRLYIQNNNVYESPAITMPSVATGEETTYYGITDDAWDNQCSALEARAR